MNYYRHMFVTDEEAALSVNLVRLCDFNCLTTDSADDVQILEIDKGINEFPGRKS